MASELPLGGSVVQRLQRYGTYGHLKQVVLAIIANEIAQQQAQTQSTLQQLKCADSSPGNACQVTSKYITAESHGCQASFAQFCWVLRCARDLDVVLGVWSSCGCLDAGTCSRGWTRTSPGR